MQQILVYGDSLRWLLEAREWLFSLPWRARRSKEAPCAVRAVALTIPRGRSFAVSAGYPSTFAVLSADLRTFPRPSSVGSVALRLLDRPLLRDFPHKLPPASLPCAIRPNIWPSAFWLSRQLWKHEVPLTVSVMVMRPPPRRRGAPSAAIRLPEGRVS